MGYEIENFGPQNDNGLKTRRQGDPHFPGSQPGGGREDLAFNQDLIRDPADIDGDFDTRTGWEKGLGIGAAE